MRKDRFTRAIYPVFLCVVSAAAVGQAPDPPPGLPILVDKSCRVFSLETAQWQPNLDVCRLDGEGVQRSSHIAAKEVDGVVQHTNVNIEEQTYLLQDIHPQPVIFVVEQKVKDGWHVDSDPPPEQMKGSFAIFRVHAEPGQIVRLHVGVAQETPIDPQQ